MSNVSRLVRRTRATGFWNFIANWYAKKPVEDQPAYERKLEATRQHFKPHFEVLEFGCGTGTTALWHAPNVSRVLGIDTSSRMVEIAAAKAAQQSIKNVEFAVGGIEELDTASEESNAPTYDAVMAHSVLHLLQDPRAAIRTVHRLLKPGGIFVSSTVCLGGGHPILRTFMAIGHFLRIMPSLRFMAPEDLRSEIAKAGFSIVHEWQSDERNLFVIAEKT